MRYVLVYRYHYYAARPLGLAPYCYSLQDLQLHLSPPWRVYSVAVHGVAFISRSLLLFHRYVTSFEDPEAALLFINWSTACAMEGLLTVWVCVAQHARLLPLLESPRLSLLEGHLSWPELLLLASSLVANVIAAIFDSAGTSWSLFPLVPMSLFCQFSKGVINVTLASHVIGRITGCVEDINLSLLALASPGPGAQGVAAFDRSLRIRSLRRQLSRLADERDRFTHCFAPFILFFMIQIAWFTTISIYFVAVKANQEGFSLGLFVSLFCISSMFQNVGLCVWNAEILSNKSKETLDILHDLHNPSVFENAENEEIRVFAAQLHERPMEISLCGFYCLSHIETFHVFSSAFAYLTTVLQFYT